MIAIVDYGRGNLRSVQKAFEYLNKMTELREQEVEKNELKRELYKIKRGLKLLIIKEKILRKTKEKKNSNTVTNLKDNKENDYLRKQKLREIKKRILARLKK